MLNLLLSEINTLVLRCMTGNFSHRYAKFAHLLKNEHAFSLPVLLNVQGAWVIRIK